MRQQAAASDVGRQSYTSVAAAQRTAHPTGVSGMASAFLACSARAACMPRPPQPPCGCSTDACQSTTCLATTRDVAGHAAGCQSAHLGEGLLHEGAVSRRPGRPALGTLRRRRGACIQHRCLQSLPRGAPPSSAGDTGRSQAFWKEKCLVRRLVKTRSRAVRAALPSAGPLRVKAQARARSLCSGETSMSALPKAISVV